MVRLLHISYTILGVFAVLFLTAIFYALYIKEGRDTDHTTLAYILIPLLPAIILAAMLSHSSLPYIYSIIAVVTATVSSLAVLYYKRGVGFYVSIVYLLLIIIYSTTNSQIQYSLMQALAIGMAIGLSYIKFTHRIRNKKLTNSAKIEKERDMTQISIGIVIMVLIVSLKYYQEYLSILTILGILFIGLTESKGIRMSIIGKLSHKIEKSDSLYGNGALLLASGVLAITAFVSDFRLMLFFVFVLLFVDPIATIVGISIKGPKLFYSRSKSVYGSLSFFVAGSVFGYAFIGFYAIPIVAFLTFIESLKTPFDDNITIAAASLLVYVLSLI